MESCSRRNLFWMQRFRRQRMWAPQCDAAWDLLTKRIQHLVILVHVYEVMCTVHVDVLDPLIMFQVWAQTSGSIISRRTSDVSLSLLSSSLLQATTNPHGHHLGVTVVKLYDEGMILKNKGEDRMLYHFYLESHQKVIKVRHSQAFKINNDSETQTLMFSAVPCSAYCDPTLGWCKRRWQDRAN